jgi:hypothetical protein
MKTAYKVAVPLHFPQKGGLLRDVTYPYVFAWHEAKLLSRRISLLTFCAALSAGGAALFLQIFNNYFTASMHLLVFLYYTLYD